MGPYELRSLVQDELPQEGVTMPRRLWKMLREPRVLTAIFGVSWVVVIHIGLSALLNPPATISNEIGDILTFIWGCFLLIGGVGGFVGCVLIPEPWWRWVEQYSIYVAGLGIIIYSVVVVYLHLTTGESRLVQGGFIVLGLLLLIIRRILISDRMVQYWRRLHGDLG